MAAGGADEIRAFAGEGTRNNAADGVFSGQDFSGRFAVLIQNVNRDDFLVRGYLENAVGRGIYDEISGF